VAGRARRWVRQPVADSSERPSSITLGLLMVAVGAMLFASKGLFAKALYARDVSSDTVVAIRALVAVPFFWAFAFAREGRTALQPTSRRGLWAAVSAGLLCYYLGALLNFKALTLIDASIERVLLFSYPAFVVVASAALERRRPSQAVVLAIVLTWLGIFLSVGGFDRGELHANVEGAALAILSGLTYGAYFMIGARYTRELGSARFTLYAMTASAAALAAHLTVTGGFAAAAAFDADTWLLLVSIGVVAMVFPALLQAEGLRRAGAVRSAVVTTVGPPTTALLAWWLLGESLTGWQMLGMALILAGILVLDLARTRTSVAPDSPA
jgi:drug/metabolite transporter (DMT)-like permease